MTAGNTWLVSLMKCPAVCVFNLLQESIRLLGLLKRKERKRSKKEVKQQAQDTIQRLMSHGSTGEREEKKIPWEGEFTLRSGP